MTMPDECEKDGCTNLPMYEMKYEDETTEWMCGECKMEYRRDNILAGTVINRSWEMEERYD